jgi:cell wall-associated NlpC family hydrolase
MPTGVELANHMYAICNGRPYAADGGRFGTYPHGQRGEHFDCSGGVSRALQDLGIGFNQFPTVSATQARYCRDRGTLVSYERAINTPGALFFWGPNRGYDGFGSGGHVAMVYRPGWSIECRGRSYGCGSWPLAGRGSVNWALIPGINYGAVSTPQAPSVPTNETDDDEEDMSETLVTWTANNVAGEWHEGVVLGGHLWHKWGPGSGGREILAGPSGAQFTSPPIKKVTKRLGVAGVLTRIDLFLEFEDESDVRQGHLWRNKNTDRFSFELVS